MGLEPEDVADEVGVDDLVGRAGGVDAPAEIPVGLITSIVAAPYFLWLLRRSPA